MIMSSGSRPVLTLFAGTAPMSILLAHCVYKKEGGRRIPRMYKEILEMANRLRFEFPCSVGARDWMVRKTLPTMVLLLSVTSLSESAMERLTDLTYVKALESLDWSDNIQAPRESVVTAGARRQLAHGREA